MYTILLYSKLPANIDEIIERGAEDNWLQFDTFKKQLEAAINNLRTLKVRKDTSLSSPSVRTMSTLMVQSKKKTSFFHNLLVVQNISFLG